MDSIAQRTAWMDNLLALEPIFAIPRSATRKAPLAVYGVLLKVWQGGIRILRSALIRADELIEFEAARVFDYFTLPRMLIEDYFKLTEEYVIGSEKMRAMVASSQEHHRHALVELMRNPCEETARAAFAIGLDTRRATLKALVSEAKGEYRIGASPQNLAMRMLESMGDDLPGALLAEGLFESRRDRKHFMAQYCKGRCTREREVQMAILQEQLKLRVSEPVRNFERDERRYRRRMNSRLWTPITRIAEKQIWDNS